MQAPNAHAVTIKAQNHISSIITALQSSTESCHNYQNCVAIIACFLSIYVSIPLLAKSKLSDAQKSIVMEIKATLRPRSRAAFELTDVSPLYNCYPLLYTIAILALLQLQQCLICEKNPCTVKHTKKRWQVIIEILWLSYCQKTHQLALPSLCPQKSLDLLLYALEEKLWCARMIVWLQSLYYSSESMTLEHLATYSATQCASYNYISLLVYIYV